MHASGHASIPSSFPAADGDIADLIRTRDWSATTLGPIDGWPQSLRTAVDIMLAATGPVSVMWGPERLQLYNDAYIPIAGERHPLALGAAVADTWREAYPGFLGPVLDQVFAGETVEIAEHAVPLLRPENSLEERFFTGSFLPVRDEMGAVAGVLHPLTEVTAKVRADADLKASEEFNRRVLDASADCIKVLDLDGRLEFMSDGGMDVMEVEDLGAVRGTSWPDFWPESERGKASAAMDEARRGGTGRFQGFATTMKGTPRWWDVVVTAINGADGRPEKLLSVARDISAIRAAEERLRELNETLEQEVDERTAAFRLYEKIVQSDPSPVCAFDRDYRLIAFNQAHSDEFFRIFGRRVRLGDVFPDQFPPDQGPIMRAFMTRALAGESYMVVEEFGDPNLAKPYWEVTYYQLRDETGEIVGAFHHARDVSARLRAEADLVAAQEALRQSQKMESMGQLTGGVAHDFNNLLTPIIGSLDMLTRREVGTERERRLVSAALQSAERAKTLVQRLLAFARRQPLQPTAVDVERLVRGMAGLILSTLGPTIRLTIEIEPDLPPARADANQLEMALLNLAVNARDAMPDGGALVISASRASVGSGHKSGLTQGRYVRLCIGDDGSGMDAQTLARAIEPFFSTKGVGKGTGLGLSMVHGLAEQLQGRMMIESMPGLGTTVELWVPVSPVALDPVRRHAPEDPPPRLTGTALLVDDEEVVRLSTADMLNDLGYQVMEAGSAEDALRLLARDFRPDVLVTDHLMPGMSGADLARALKRERPALPVLIVSGYAEAAGIPSDVARLTKPFRQADLAASLAAIQQSGTSNDRAAG